MNTVNTMNKYFQNVFVINREIDKCRMYKTHKILTKNNIKYTRFEAVVIDKDTDFNITNEMLGCALSHINIWKTVVVNGMDNALIFEDDIMLVNNWDEILNKSMIDVPQDWDILTLGNFGIKDQSDKYTSPFNFILYTIVSLFNLQNKRHTKITDNIISPYFFTGLYGYAISFKGAKKLLSLIKDVKDIKFHIDVLISCKSDYLHIYSLKKDIVYQRIENSTINTNAINTNTINRNTTANSINTDTINRNTTTNSINTDTINTDTNTTTNTINTDTINTDTINTDTINTSTTLENYNKNVNIRNDFQKNHSKVVNLKIHLDLLKSVDNKNIKYNYYMNVPVYKLRCTKGYNIIINGWFIILVLIILFILLYIIIKNNFRL